MERCPNCGASIRTGARFCTACGFRLIQAAESTPVVPVIEPSTAVSAEPAERIVWHGETHTSATPTATHAERSTSPVSEESTDQATAAVQPDAATEVGANSGATAVLPSSPEANPDETSLESTIADEGADAESIGSSTGNTYPGDGEPVSEVMESAEDIESTETNDLNPSDMTNGNSSSGSSESELETTDVGHIAPSEDDLTQQASSTDHSGETLGSNEEGPDGLNDGTPAVELATKDSLPAESEAGTPTGSTGFDERQDSEHDLADVDLSWGSTSTDDFPNAGQDDVVIGTAFVDDTVHFETVSDGGSERESTAADSGSTVPEDSPESKSHSVETGEVLEQSPTGVSAVALEYLDQPGGSDADWEPWADGVSPDGHAAPDTDTTGVMADSATGRGSSGTEAGSSTASLARARNLLAELQAVMAEVDQQNDRPAIEPETQCRIDAAADASQVLGAFAGPAVDPERLAELTGLAKDLSGRDYDIRALQRFAQERELILELASGFEQQRDLIEQVRSILSPDQE